MLLLNDKKVKEIKPPKSFGGTTCLLPTVLAALKTIPINLLSSFPFVGSIRKSIVCSRLDAARFPFFKKQIHNNEPGRRIVIEAIDRFTLCPVIS